MVTELEDAGRAVLDRPDLAGVDGDRFEPAIVARQREFNAALAAGLRQDPDPDAGTSPTQQRRELQRMMIEAYQAALLDARATGFYRSHVIEKAQRVLDSRSALLGG